MDDNAHNFEALVASVDNLQSNANHVWTMVAAALVLLMQVGFLLLEAGMVRSKNSINVAQKNISDFLISVCMFYLVGFGLMFGVSAGGFWGTDNFGFNQVEDWQFTFFVFQAMFVGTAATIMSGAVAERMKYYAYLAAAFLLAVLIYPVFGHWAWGNLLIGDNPAYLADLGFIDFAGSTVVHSVGAWVGLAGIVVLGPRLGRFDAEGKPVALQGHSYVLVGAGAILLWVGWIGFNAGSTTTADPALAKIAMNTIVAASFGGALALVAGRLGDGLYSPHRSINGSLAGLAAITAGCDAVLPQGAMLIGAMAGVLVVLSEYALERLFKLDDVVGAVSVHGTCGAFGTLALAFFATPDKLALASRWDQFLVQGQGVALAFIWSFGLAYALFKVLDLTIGIRVSREDEELGLNMAEHGASLGSGELRKKLDEMSKKDQFDLTIRLDETSGDESAELAQLLNPFLDKVRTMVVAIQERADGLSSAATQLDQLSTALLFDSDQSREMSSHIQKMTYDVNGRAESSAQLMEQIGQSVESVAGLARQMSDHVRGATDEFSDVKASLCQVVEKTDRARGVTEKADNLASDAAHAIEAMEAASREIVEVVNLIDKISLETNMLAVNASVEANRAGEDGKGFVVIAEQVRNLSQQTANATHRIRDKIGQMRLQSDATSEMFMTIVDLMNTINSSVRDIAEQTGKQMERTESFCTQMDEAADISGTVSEHILRLHETGRDVTSNALETSKMLVENAARVEQLSANADNTAERAAQMADDTKQVLAGSRNLSVQSSKFRTRQGDHAEPSRPAPPVADDAPKPEFRSRRRSG